MRYIRKKRFPTPYRRTTGRKGKRRGVALAAALLSFVWGIFAETGLSSVSQELTEEAAREYLVASINQAVKEELSGMESEFVSVSQSGNGTVSAINLDAAALNSLKTGILSRLSKSLSGHAVAWTPLGSFTDVGILNGRGPKVPVKLNMEGSADVEFQTEFRSAGVNQSCHRVTMTVKAKAYSQSKRFETQVEEKTATVLAETVVVGEVPEIVLAETGLE